MLRENYIWFWGIFFAITVIGGLGIIACLALIARYLRELKEIHRRLAKMTFRKFLMGGDSE